MAKDLYHQAIKNALVKDGWTITGDLIRLLQDEYEEIYLAIKDEVYNTFFQRKSIQVLVKLNQLALLVVNIEKEEIVQWTS